MHADWNISDQEYWGDDELRGALQRVLPQLQHSHRIPLADRIETELSDRAGGFGGLSADALVIVGIGQYKKWLHEDIEARAGSQSDDDTFCLNCGDLFPPAEVCEECGNCQSCCDCADRLGIGCNSPDGGDDEWGENPYADEDPRSWEFNRAYKRHIRAEAKLLSLGL